MTNNNLQKIIDIVHRLQEEMLRTMLVEVRLQVQKKLEMIHQSERRNHQYWQEVSCQVREQDLSKVLISLQI